MTRAGRIPRLPLHRHPTTPCTCADAISVEVAWLTEDLLCLKYGMDGDIDALHLPARVGAISRSRIVDQRSQHTDGLWRSTCFEAFLKLPGARDYVEINVSPSTRWAVYRFEDYRRGMQAFVPERPPQIVLRRREDRLEADIELHLSSLGIKGDSDLLLGVATVLQDRSGQLSCWALTHPAGEPDFHHPDCLVLTLSRPRSRG